MKIERLARIVASLAPSNHPYLNGAWTPGREEVNADENTGTSECILIDSARLEDGPVCRIALPHKLCSGTHACWAPREQLRVPAPF